MSIDLASLAPPMAQALRLAWQSWGEGNYGIGAVLVDGEDIVSEGRNRVRSAPTRAQPLGGNFLAHAEMNAFASLDRYNARGLVLHTTLEPCLMCAASAIFMNVAHVHFLAGDEFFAGMHDELWPAFAYTRDRRPAMTGPATEELANVARLMPMHHTMATVGDSRPADRARADHPRLAELAASPEVGELRQRASAMTAEDGFAALAALLEA